MKDQSSNYRKYVKFFLRFAVAIGFLSASADRFGMLPEAVSAWGNWANFVDYTQVLNPWLPESLIPFVAVLATIAEVVFGIGLLIGFKTEWMGKMSGFLLLAFAIAMSFTVGIKKVFDFSVFSASAAAFAISIIHEKYLEIDVLFKKKTQ